MFRGILSTIYVDLKKNVKPITIYDSIKKYYKKKFFIKLAKFNKPIGTRSPGINTNPKSFAISPV